MIDSTPGAAATNTGTGERDEFDGRDRVWLEKLRLAATVIIDLADDPGIVNDILQTELYLFRDRVDRALLLPGDGD